VSINWFGRPVLPPESKTPLPPTDHPAAPLPAPKLSPERQAAVDQAIRDGKARSVKHALFLANAGALSLPA